MTDAHGSAQGVSEPMSEDLLNGGSSSATPGNKCVHLGLGAGKGRIEEMMRFQDVQLG